MAITFQARGNKSGRFLYVWDVTASDDADTLGTLNISQQFQSDAGVLEKLIVSLIPIDAVAYEARWTAVVSLVGGVATLTMNKRNIAASSLEDPQVEVLVMLPPNSWQSF